MGRARHRPGRETERESDPKRRPQETNTSASVCNQRTRQIVTQEMNPKGRALNHVFEMSRVWRRAVIVLWRREWREHVAQRFLMVWCTIGVVRAMTVLAHPVAQWEFWPSESSGPALSLGQNSHWATGWARTATGPALSLGQNSYWATGWARTVIALTTHRRNDI